jgi:hypothetical protein
MAAAEYSARYGSGSMTDDAATAEEDIEPMGLTADTSDDDLVATDSAGSLSTLGVDLDTVSAAGTAGRHLLAARSLKQRHNDKVARFKDIPTKVRKHVTDSISRLSKHITENTAMYSKRRGSHGMMSSPKMSTMAADESEVETATLDEPMEDSEPTGDLEPIIETLSADPVFSTLVAAVSAAADPDGNELTDALAGMGPFTARHTHFPTLSLAIVICAQGWRWQCFERYKSPPLLHGVCSCRHRLCSLLEGKRPHRRGGPRLA